MKSTSRPLTCFVLILLLTCVALAAIGLGTLQVMRRAEALFGPPADTLSLTQRLSYAIMLVVNNDKLTRPYQPLGEEVEFSVMPGEPTTNILGRLWENGLIPDPSQMRTYLQYSGLDTTIQAGTYKLSAAMSPLEIAWELQDATPTEVTFNILSGWRLEEIAAAMEFSGLNISPELFLLAAENPPAAHRLTVELPDEADLEGFLMPGTYSIPRQSGVETLLMMFMDRFEENLNKDMEKGFKRQGLDLYEAVTLASIVEREAVIDEEKPLIASVFLNRLAQGMKLDADPTVQYALGRVEERGGYWPSPLSLSDLEVNSPYNTYRYAGLPPGPIANPSVESLRAVAFPAETPYYYFRADCDGSGRHAFAETFEQHLQNGCP